VPAPDDSRSCAASNWPRYEPDGSDAHLVFELRPGACNDETLITFLTDVHAVEQRAVLLIWDGLPSIAVGE
jgi:hypothetical protein